MRRHCRTKKSKKERKKNFMQVLNDASSMKDNQTIYFDYYYCTIFAQQSCLTAKNASQNNAKKKFSQLKKKFLFHYQNLKENFIFCKNFQNKRKLFSNLFLIILYIFFTIFSKNVMGFSNWNDDLSDVLGGPNTTYISQVIFVTF